jgi:hypothetical protein
VLLAQTLDGMLPLRARDRLGQLQTRSKTTQLTSSSMRSLGSTLLRSCGAKRCQPLLQQQQGVPRPSLIARRNIKLSAVEAAAPTTSSVDSDSSSTSQQPGQAYPFPDIEAKWQQYWEQQQTFRTPDEVDTSKPKYYVLDMFPYPRCEISAVLGPMLQLWVGVSVMGRRLVRCAVAVLWCCLSGSCAQWNSVQLHCSKPQQLRYTTQASPICFRSMTQLCLDLLGTS